MPGFIPCLERQGSFAHEVRDKRSADGSHSEINFTQCHRPLLCSSPNIPDPVPCHQIFFVMLLAHHFTALDLPLICPDVTFVMNCDQM